MILDFGCGSAEDYHGKTERVVGIDIRLKRLAKAKSRIQVVHCDGTFLPFASMVFDHVTVDSVLEHIKDYRQALQEIRRVLSTEGTCKITQPVDNDPVFFIARRLTPIWHGDPVRSRFNAHHLMSLLTNSNLKITSKTYLASDPVSTLLVFCGRKPSKHLGTIDKIYGLFSMKLGMFQKVTIELRHGNSKPS